MSIIYVCMGETNCATGKRIPGHFFTFKSCIVCKCKVKIVFPLPGNWWVALRILCTPWKEMEFSVVIFCNTKWCPANCFVPGSENSGFTRGFLCSCPEGSLSPALLGWSSGIAGVAPACLLVIICWNCLMQRSLKDLLSRKFSSVSLEMHLGPQNTNWVCLQFFRYFSQPYPYLLLLLKLRYLLPNSYLTIHSGVEILVTSRACVLFFSLSAHYLLSSFLQIVLLCRIPTIPGLTNPTVQFVQLLWNRKNSLGGIRNKEHHEAPMSVLSNQWNQQYLLFHSWTERSRLCLLWWGG